MILWFYSLCSLFMVIALFSVIYLSCTVRSFFLPVIIYIDRAYIYLEADYR